MSNVRQLQAVALVALALLLLITFKSSSFETPTLPSVNKFAASTAEQISAKAKSIGLLEHLEDTLQRLESTPVLSYDEALAKNERTCKGREVQSNPDQIKGESSFWRNLASEEVERKRQDIVDGIRGHFGLPGLLGAGLDDLTTTSTFGTRDRGLVFTGGNKDTLKRIGNSLRILRNRHNCQLPVEIFAFPEELAASSSKLTIEEVSALGDVTFKELHSSSKHTNLWKNFQIKAESIVKSSFSEVLYLDSDNILLADPTYLFEHQLYKKNGVVFWPDITKDGPANPIWRMLDMQCKREDYQLDSGQILVDKRGQGGMNLAALIAALEMQKDFDFWFKLSGGDKDTFRYGFYFLGLPYSTPEHWLSSLGPIHSYQTDGHTFCGLAMLQYSLSPADWSHFSAATPSALTQSNHAPPLFVHANLLKHSAGYRQGQIWTHLKHMKDDRMAGETDQFRSTVYTSRNGMCVDIWDAFDETNPRQDGTFDNGDAIIEDATTAFGGVFKGFEEMFWAEGGRAGGF